MSGYDNNQFLAEDIVTNTGTNPKKCMRCGKCSATCPSEMDFFPHKFVKKLAENNIDDLLKSKSLWKCFSCLACVERCPRGVEPASLIEAVRLTIIREQGKNYLTPDDIPELVELDEEMPQQLLVSAFRKYSK
jgi:heterodisulfide reductase subunit C